MLGIGIASWPSFARFLRVAALLTACFCIVQCCGLATQAQARALSPQTAGPNPVRGYAYDWTLADTTPRANPHSAMQIARPESARAPWSSTSPISPRRAAKAATWRHRVSAFMNEALASALVESSALTRRVRHT